MSEDGCLHVHLWLSMWGDQGCTAWRGKGGSSPGGEGGEGRHEGEGQGRRGMHYHSSLYLTLVGMSVECELLGGVQKTTTVLCVYVCGGRERGVSVSMWWEGERSGCECGCMFVCPSHVIVLFSSFSGVGVSSFLLLPCRRAFEVVVAPLLDVSQRERSRWRRRTHPPQRPSCCL